MGKWEESAKALMESISEASHTHGKSMGSLGNPTSNITRY
jgi:hypothetical protein